MAYDAWGARRDLQGDPAVISAASGTLNGQALIDNKGFTHQEELDQLGLVHLNGRVYDPFTGRFLSGDPDVADPYHSQSYNRYAYVWNNPTNMTDPTGFDPDGQNNSSPQPNKVEIRGQKEPTGLTWGQRFDYIRRAASDAAVGAGRAVSRVARPVGNFTARVTVRAAPTIVATSVGSVEVGSNLNPFVDGAEAVEWLVSAVVVAATAEEAADKKALDGGGSAAGGAPDPDDGGDKDKKKTEVNKPQRTEHGEQRAQEAKTDAHRNVGDANRVINEGKTLIDNDTGNTVHVLGDRVVITNEEGEVVTQFKNTRANTQQRIDSGRWSFPDLPDIPK